MITSLALTLLCFFVGCYALGWMVSGIWRLLKRCKRTPSRTAGLTRFEKSIILVTVRATIDVMDGASPNELERQSRSACSDQLSKDAVRHILDTVNEEVKHYEHSNRR